MRHARRLFVGCTALIVWFAHASAAPATPTVWSELSFTFTNPGGVFPPANDPITANVALTRGLARGLYNAAVESAFDFSSFSSPAGTKWATFFNNPTATIAATNWQALTFDTWFDAYGGGGIGNRIENLDAVVHLTTDDIYLDLRFTDWVNGMDEGGGGGFTYMRAVAPPPPTPTGDYNGDHVVNAADSVVWRDTFGQTVTSGQGADGNSSGMIDAGDYDFWKARFGNVVPGAGAVASLMPVPEPGAVVLIGAALCLLGLRRAR